MLLPGYYASLLGFMITFPSGLRGHLILLKVKLPFSPHASLRQAMLSFSAPMMAFGLFRFSFRRRPAFLRPPALEAIFI